MDVSDQADDEQVNGETEKVSPRRRGIYLAPNLITTGALFAGFYAIVAGMNGNFVAAALAIYVAMLLDTLDDMEAARQLYAELGFQEVAPYYHNPLPGAHYLKVDL